MSILQIVGDITGKELKKVLPNMVKSGQRVFTHTTPDDVVTLTLKEGKDLSRLSKRFKVFLEVWQHRIQNFFKKLKGMVSSKGLAESIQQQNIRATEGIQKKLEGLTGGTMDDIQAILSEAPQQNRLVEHLNDYLQQVQRLAPGTPADEMKAGILSVIEKARETLPTIIRI